MNAMQLVLRLGISWETGLLQQQRREAGNVAASERGRSWKPSK